MFQASLPVRFWGECVLAAGHLINRTPTPLLDGKTPYEMLYGTSPSFTSLNVFGCLGYTHKYSRDKEKFGERSRRCVFVGYPYGKKGWRMYDLDTNEFLISRDVIFHETVFLFSSNIIEAESSSSPLADSRIYCDDDFLETEQDVVI